jgi:hypothetical protein
MGSVIAFHADKPIVQVAAIEKTINHFFDILPPEALPSKEMPIINPDEGLKIVQRILA